MKQKDKNQHERLESCDPTHMFSNMLNHVEDKHKNEKMPVRNFYNNTFGELVNGALFALNKKISKVKDDEANELQLCEGKIKFLALYIMEHLPEGELIPEDANAKNDD